MAQNRVRPFFAKTQLNATAIASAYTETQPFSEQEVGATKISCAFFGPMQLTQQGSSVSADGCVIKVNIEFPDEQKSALLKQMPQVNEALQAVAESMPTEAVAQMQQEQKLKQLITQLSYVMSGILSSSIATESYQGTLITCTFNIVELDQDILQAMVNCACAALLSSSLKCRCLPVAITMLHAPTPNNVLVDPSVNELTHVRKFAHKLRLVFNPDTEELIYSSMEETILHAKPMELETIE